MLLIATNHIDRFDTAVSRPGRIDLIVPVGPPDKAQRASILEKAAGLSPVTAQHLAGLLREGTALSELLLFKKISAPGITPGADQAIELNNLWNARNRPAIIDAPALKKFQDDTQLRRLD